MVMVAGQVSLTGFSNGDFERRIYSQAQWNHNDEAYMDERELLVQI